MGRKRPPTGEEIDIEHRRKRLREISDQLQDDANRGFPNHTTVRYSRIYVLLISWTDEDPKLPVSLELQDLSRVFSDEYGFQTESWQIPSDNSHNELSKKILDFIGINKDAKDDLKIVYYGGHGMLTRGRQLAWTKYIPIPTTLYIS